MEPAVRLDAPQDLGVALHHGVNSQLFITASTVSSSSRRQQSALHHGVNSQLFITASPPVSQQISSSPSSTAARALIKIP
ncbi:hypothetical protein EYF80_065177 [Liparis tanakae]|uniref:Uncharacterized protein n=1 Tax=Liparis tanakae TaxID=230148 RepID=A0A4Z2E7E5_9TELE|nr:hypothetical protein EYF80_065177 [Liparis tanakae]